MKDHATELKKSARRGKDKAAEAEAAAQDVVDKIAEMPGPDRELGEKIHAIVTKNAPGLAPRLWYGQPAYAKDGKVLCFFQPASKFKTRYATLGFSDEANLDDGAMWPSAFALTKLTAADEKRIAELVKRAAS
ncbi:iron chaperone [Hamadaea tsunoensis]|uniref:iron chaperone n=1 Tax=Hamadaea tsunoensis TaxID=53368 RepID=UPI000A01ECF5|nr:DUF1801 domain-containing protein [Hamadaea tsunoensis]